MMLVTRARMAVWCGVAMVLLASCAGASTATNPLGGATSSTSATATGPGLGTAASGTAPPSSTTAVHAITIEVDDATAGRLVFDAIAAGDPAAAHDGKLVLLLHGFPETDEAWREQLPALAEQGYYAVAPNQRGYSPGARPSGVASYSIVALIGDVFAMATALGADQFHLVGHDWGAGVAWVAAAAKPERVRTLTALSVPHPDAFAAAFDAPDGEQTRKSQYVAVFTAAGSEDRFTANDAAGLRALYGTTVPKDKVDAYVRVLGTPEALGAALNWYRATDFHTHPPIGKVHVPTLFLWSTDDVAIARAGADATKDFVDGPYRYEVLDGVSHWIPEEAPDRVRELLRTQLASTTSTPSTTT